MNRVPGQLAALLAMVVGATASAAWAADQPAKADLVNGQKIAGQACAACHGADGGSVSPANPHLAGQFPEYLNKQLVNFKGDQKAALRDSPIMKPMATPLSANDMRDVA